MFAYLRWPVANTPSGLSLGVIHTLLRWDRRERDGRFTDELRCCSDDLEQACWCVYEEWVVDGLECLFLSCFTSACL